MSDKDYTIQNVQKREPWRSNYGGDMQSYAIQLEGVEGWVELSQRAETPEPQVGGILHGHTEAMQRGSQTYLKFKKVNPNYPQQSYPQTTPSELVGTAKTLDYVVEMLEELTGRTKQADVLPDDDDVIEGEEFDLAEIPF